MPLDVDLIRQFLIVHAETILTWLVAGLVMLALARFELRRSVRRSVTAMSESVATTVAACIPDIAHAAAQAGRADATADGPGAQIAQVDGQRADALRRLALDTVATVMARTRWLESLGNLRLSEDALLAGPRAGGADPILVVAPQPVVQAYLSAQRVFDDEAVRVQLLRRDAIRAQEAAQAAAQEAAHVEQETASIVMRFEQANAQAVQGGQVVEGGDYQRFLIQKYNALGQREKEIVRERGELQVRAAEAADALANSALAASRRYALTLSPLMAQLRAAWGHGESPDVFETWVRGAAQGPAGYTADRSGGAGAQVG